MHTQEYHDKDDIKLYTLRRAKMLLFQYKVFLSYIPSYRHVCMHTCLITHVHKYMHVQNVRDAMATLHLEVAIAVSL